ncbi:MAG: PIN domain-containing protein [bacterium]|nr:PIN domain-containing protein [bacterium]
MAKAITEILDTNVLLRFLVGDIPAQKKQAEQWFFEAEQGEREIVVTSLVVAETIFVLEGFYHQSRRKISEAMEIFLSQRWLTVSEREVLLTALRPYRKKAHFVDAYLIASRLVNHVGILTFDKALKKQV